MAQLPSLMQRIDYRFNDESLLLEALSHRSSGSRSYERLEFLGDSFLNFVIAAELYQLRPAEDEGALSRLRASLVRGSTLAEIARELSLGSHLQMGVGELRSGGFKRDSVLADAVESIIGGVLIDGGYEAARSLVLRLFSERLQSLPESGDLKDPKTRLQELLQGKGLERAQYEVIDTRGKDHQREFTVEASVPEPSLTTRATSSSRRKAEQAAAVLMLDKLANKL